MTVLALIILLAMAGAAIALTTIWLEDRSQRRRRSQRINRRMSGG